MHEPQRVLSLAPLTSQPLAGSPSQSAKPVTHPATVQRPPSQRGVALGPGDRDDLLVFHAGTTEADGRVLTSGGRVLCVTALGDSVKIAQSSAYERIAGIGFAGMQYRSDIGHRALARKR
jgi:phosphoribosylamine-glycine ligase